jgi:hypothetical protein
MITEFLYYDFAFPNKHKYATFHEMALNKQYLFAESCSPGAEASLYTWCVCVREVAWSKPYNSTDWK